MKDITHYFTSLTNSSKKSNVDAKQESKPSSTTSSKQENSRKVSLEKQKDAEKKTSPPKRRGRPPKKCVETPPEAVNNGTISNGNSTHVVEISSENFPEKVDSSFESEEVITCPIVKHDEDILTSPFPNGDSTLKEINETIVNSNAAKPIVEAIKEPSKEVLEESDHENCNKTDLQDKSFKRKRIDVVFESSVEEAGIVNQIEQKNVEMKIPEVPNTENRKKHSINKLKKFKFEKRDKTEDTQCINIETNGKVGNEVIAVNEPEMLPVCSKSLDLKTVDEERNVPKRSKTTPKLKSKDKSKIDAALKTPKSDENKRASESCNLTSISKCESYSPDVKNFNVLEVETTPKSNPNVFQRMMSGGSKILSSNSKKESSDKKEQNLPLKSENESDEKFNCKAKTLSLGKRKSKKRRKSTDRSSEDEVDKSAEKKTGRRTEQSISSVSSEKKSKTKNCHSEGFKNTSDPKSDDSPDVSVTDSKAKIPEEKSVEEIAMNIPEDSTNDDEEDDDSLQLDIKPLGLYNYFSPISRAEAMKKSRDSLVTRTVTADIHNFPPPEDGQKHSLGPSRRSHFMSTEADEIMVIKEIPNKQPKNKVKCSIPEKKRSTKKPWSLKIRLLSPVKPLQVPEESDSSSDLDSDCSDASDSSCSPEKPSSQKVVPVASIFAPKNRAIEKASRKIFMSTPLPSIRPEKTEHTIGFADVDPSTPMCVLYPSISHITQIEKSEKTEVDKQEQFPFTLTINDYIPKCPPFECGILLNILEPQEKGVLSYVIPESNITQELWTDTYRPKSAGEVAGNSKSVQMLKQWLDGWKQRSTLLEELSPISESESSDYSSGDDFIVSDDEDSDNDHRAKSKKKKKKKHINTAILTGPCGSGKTAAVYAVAEELGFKVLEMNASSKRSGKRILSELQEATQSHRVNNATDQDSISAFFSASSKAKEQPKNSVIESQQSGNGSGLSLILVEDVDVVFEEQDEGFIAALNTLAASSKRPLILVSNDPHCTLLLAKHRKLHLDFTKVPSVCSGAVVQKLCESVNHVVQPDQINHVLQETGGDMRRSIMQLQAWVMSGGFPKLSNNIPYPLDLGYVWRGLGRTPLPFMISDADIEEEETQTEANKTWQSFNDDDDEIFPPPKQKKMLKRQRLTSDSFDNYDASNSTFWPSDLHKTQFLTNLLSELDVMQGCYKKSYGERPGLSDQPCLDGVVSNLGTELQHWLASKALKYSNCQVATKSSEEIDRWTERHLHVDRDLLEQLPATSKLDHQATSIDLIPALRGFGRIEQLSARSSRRSRLNALQGMGFTPTPLTIESLVFVLPDSEELLK